MDVCHYIEQSNFCNFCRENKILHQKLDEMRSMIGIEQGDNFHNESTTSSPDMFTFTQNFDRNHNQPNSDTENE